MPLHDMHVREASTGVATTVALPNAGKQSRPAGSTVDEVRAVNRSATEGAVWVLLAFFAARTLGIATNLVLARLLSPDEFGLVSFSMILIGAFTTLQDLGVPASIVYNKRDISVIGGTALTINIVASLALFGVALLVSPMLARIGGDADIAPIAVALAIGLIISALGSVQRAMLVKELAFRRKFVPDSVPLIVSGITSIAFAFLGFGAWSLVIGYIVKVSMSTLLLWSLSPVRPWPRLDLSIARELLGYGKHVSMTSIVGFIGINIDYFIVGHSFGTYDLGLYALAFTISNLPCVAIGQTTQAVMFPAYARIRDDTDGLLTTFANTFTLVSILSVSAAIALFVAGPIFVPLVLGNKWSGISGPLQALAIYSGFRSIAMGFSPFYRAIGRPNLEFRLNLVRIVLMIPLMVYLTRYGLIGVPVAYVMMAAIFVPLNGVMMSRTMRLPKDWLPRLAGPHLVGSLAAACVITGWKLTRDIGPIESLLVTMFAICAYLLAVVLLDRQILSTGRAAIVSRLPG